MSITLFTADEIMQRGLLLVGYKLKQTVQRSTKVKWFRENFGSVPIVYAEVLEDLQMAPNLEDRLVVTDPDKDLRHFLHGIFFLRKYPTESDGSPRFDMSDRTARDSKWALVKKLQALKDKKIVWPEEWTAEGDIPVFLVSVDGIPFAQAGVTV